MRKLTVAAAVLGLAVGGLLTPALAAASPTTAVEQGVRSGTLTLSIQSGICWGITSQTSQQTIDSGQLTLRGDGNEWSVQSGQLTLGGTEYAVQSGTLTLSDPDATQSRTASGTLTLGGAQYGFEAQGFDALGLAASAFEY